MNINIPAIDISASKEGRFFDCPYADGVKFKLARYMNPAHAKGMRALLDAHKDDEDGDKEKIEQLAIEIVELMAETVLIDWKGLNDGGEPPVEIPYSKEVAIELLTDESYAHLQGWVEMTAKEISNYYEKEAKDSVK